MASRSAMYISYKDGVTRGVVKGRGFVMRRCGKRECNRCGFNKGNIELIKLGVVYQ